MARFARMLIPEEPTVYHVMSRTALDGFPFGEVEKDFLLNLIKQLSGIYFVEIMGFCIMDNHFHLLVKMLPETIYTDQEIIERYELYYGKELFEGQIPFFRQKWSNLSEFIKAIKQTFTVFYNKRHGRKGFLWGGRFKSVIVENGETLTNCLAYIDLNPVRAGIVKTPEKYRWNSLGYHMQTANKDNFLSSDFGLVEFRIADKIKRLEAYIKFVYQTGAIIVENTEGNIREDLELTRAKYFKYKSRYFADSCVIGSKEFVRKNYQRFKNIFDSKNEKIPKQIKGLNGIFSLKRLNESN